MGRGLLHDCEIFANLCLKLYMKVTCGLSPALYFLGMREHQAKVSPLPETPDIQKRKSTEENDILI